MATPQGVSPKGDSPKGGFEEPDNEWEAGNEDDPDHDKFKVPLDDRDVAKIIPPQQKGKDPKQPARDIEGGKPAVFHFPNPGHKGGKGPDDW